MAGEDLESIAWVKQQPCVVKHCCSSTIEAHHRIQGRHGQRRTHDHEAIPLCAVHHHQLHHYGQETFRRIHPGYDEIHEVERHQKRHKIWMETDDERPF